MSHKLNSAIAVIGIDIGKNSFHVVGQDKRGAITLRQKWSRGQVEHGWSGAPADIMFIAVFDTVQSARVALWVARTEKKLQRW